jgi:hypothetical protein
VGERFVCERFVGMGFVGMGFVGKGCARERNQRACQLVLQGRCVSRLTTDSGFSCAGLAACGLFALETKHITHITHFFPLFLPVVRRCIAGTGAPLLLSLCL